MNKIKINEQGKVADKDSFYGICTYDESSKSFKVIVTKQALDSLKKFDPETGNLEKVFEWAVEWALSEGKQEGDILVKSDTPEFHQLERYLRLKFKT